MSQQRGKNLDMDLTGDRSDNEVESALRVVDQEQPRNNTFPFLGRQSSIYSLTIDEFQNTLSGSGKNFGSMNMDEFINNIWNAEESQAQAQNVNAAVPTTGTTVTTAKAPIVTSPDAQYLFGEQLGTSKDTGNIARQMSLPRQGSLTVPATLCLKTVEEVWSEINKTQQRSSNVRRSGSKQREATFGEMTLEDFLVRAGIVQEQGHLPAMSPPTLPPAALLPPPPPPPPPPPRPLLLSALASGPPPQPYVYFNYNTTSAAVSNYMILGPGAVPPDMTAMPKTGGGDVASYFPCGNTSGSTYQPRGNCYGGLMPKLGVGGKIYGQVGEATSPVSSDGNTGSVKEKPVKKRIIDGPVERVVERRQKRMIKNRESAARSRARKHAYTIELEADLNHLRDENAQLKQTLAELEIKVKQQKWCNLMMLFDGEEYNEAKRRALNGAKERRGRLRRSISC